MYSAIKRAGTPLYKLARQGIEVDRTPRRVRIESFCLRLHDAVTLAFEVACSKGTYIRVLARDVAAALGTVGHLTSLRRTRFGRFDEGDAVSLERLEAGEHKVIELTEALRELRAHKLESGDVHRARSGFVPLLRDLPAGNADEAMRLIDRDDKLIAVVTCDRAGVWRYARVFS
jgi:tRNA pseudouridine55 synthase